MANILFTEVAKVKLTRNDYRGSTTNMATMKVRMESNHKRCPVYYYFQRAMIRGIFNCHYTCKVHLVRPFCDGIGQASDPWI